MFTKTMLIVFFSVIFIAIGVNWWFTKSVVEVDIPTTVNRYVINFQELNTHLYFRAKTWSVSGNHEEIVLSCFSFEEKQQPSKDECFIFNTSEVYYKKEGADTLLVYVVTSALSEIPKNFSTPIKIIQMELKNYDEAKDYEMNYKKYGLSKINVYKNK